MQKATKSVAMEANNNSSSPEAEGAGGGIKLQDPNEQLKPTVTEAAVPWVIPKLFGLQPKDIKSLPSYDDLNFYFRAEDKWHNEHITSLCESGYVLKILNSLQSSEPAIIDAQHALIKRANEQGIPTQTVVKTTSGKDWSLEWFQKTDNGSQELCGPYIVRVMTYIPGKIFVDTPYVPGSFYNIGQFVGKLHNAITGFHHPFYDTYTTIWSLLEIPTLQDFLHILEENEGDRRIVSEVIEDFKQHVVPNYPQFRKGVIHGDINEQNLIVSEVPGQDNIPTEARVHDVTGILDFSDVTSSYHVFDVALCIAYLGIECPEKDQIDVGGHVLAGYFKHSSLNEVELGCLKTLVCGRLCQSLVYGLHSYMQQPGNTYLLTTSGQGWPLLRKLWKTDEKKLRERWNDILQTYS